MSEDQTNDVAADEAESEDQEQSFSAQASRPKNLDVVLNIPVRLSMEVGHTKMTIRNLLRLGKGSVVELSLIHI